MGFSSLWLGQKKLSISFIDTTAWAHRIKVNVIAISIKGLMFLDMNRIVILKYFRCQIFTQLSKSLIFLYIVRFDFQTSMNVFCIDPVRTGPRVTTVLGPTPVAVPRDGRAKTVIQVQHQWHHHF